MDTICAIATAPGGAIGVIRLSGPESFPIICKVCRRITETTLPRTAVLTPIVSNDGTILDEAVVTLFPAPHSYTGDDCAELSCHGSQYILNKVLELLVQQGCRLANPGEFTQRAFLNGKMDLSQAEAVADLIASTNRATHQLAMNQLRGQFSSELNTLREQLLHLTTLLELELDFSDHEELEFANRRELHELAIRTQERITSLAQSFETGQALKQGIPVAIVGKTNVGKSTLLNRLLKDDRAIVSDIHGTTRDTIEDTINIRGIQFRFIDTAGIRETSDQVEQIGIKRTFSAINRARIVLWLIDTDPSLEELKEMVERCMDRSLIIIRNKSDLTVVNCSQQEVISSMSSAIGNHHESIPYISLSAKYDKNLNTLEEVLFSVINLPSLTDADVIVTSARHYEALLRAHESLDRVIDGLSSDIPSDLIAEDLRITLDRLSEITGGAITPQETLNNIFSNFCVGK